MNFPADEAGMIFVCKSQLWFFQSRRFLNASYANQRMTRINPGKFAKFAYSWHSRSKPAGLPSDFGKTMKSQYAPVVHSLEWAYNRTRQRFNCRQEKQMLPDTDSDLEPDDKQGAPRARAFSIS